MNLSFAGIGVSALALVGLLLAAGQASRLRNDLHALDDRVKTIEGEHHATGPAPKAANDEETDQLRDEMAKLRAMFDGIKENEDKMASPGNPSGLTMIDFRAAVEAALADRERQKRSLLVTETAVKAAQHNDQMLAKVTKDWGLTPEQSEKIRGILAEQLESYKGMWNKEVPDTSRQLNEETQKKIEAVLTDEQKGMSRAKPLDFFMSHSGGSRRDKK